MTNAPRPAVAPALALALLAWWPVGESAIMEGPPHTSLTGQPAEGRWNISHQ
jgi:hypothetical protein